MRTCISPPGVRFELDLVTLIVFGVKVTRLLTGKIAEIPLSAEVQTYAWFGPIGTPYKQTHDMKITLKDIVNNG
jgi:hypothetical protein